MKLTYLGHACFMLESGGYSVVMDPYAPDSVPGLKEITMEANAVTCSHSHSDHSYVEAVHIVKKESPFKISTMECFHDDVEGSKRGRNLIHIFEAEGKRIAHFGDLGHTLSSSQIASLGHLDVALVPVGGYYTISADEAKHILDGLDVHTIVPMHYRTKTSGYDVISTVEAFTSLYNDVLYAGTSVLVSADLPKIVVMEQEKAK